MRFLSYTTKDSSSEEAGCLVGADRVLPLSAIPEMPRSLQAFIRLGSRAVEAIDRTLSNKVDPQVLLPLDTLTIIAPIPRPLKNVFCVGRNYKAHVDEGHRARGEQITYPDVPQFFTKAPTAVFGPHADAHLDTTVTQMFDYEAELGVVIGRDGKNISERDALDHVFGYTIINDLTARDVQKNHGQWFKGKSLDNSCAMGPWIVHASTISDPQMLDIALTVNGEQRQGSNTSKMIFPIARIIADLSRGMTLEAGDVIATGTPEGVGFGMTPQQFLCDGDEIQIDIESIGTLVTRVKQVA